MVAGDAEMVVEADIQGARGELSLVFRPPLRVFVLFAVAEVPFADGGGVVAFLLQQGGQVEAVRLDVERRECAEDLMGKRSAPAVASGEQGVAGGGADGGRRVAVGEAAAFGGESVDGWGADQFRVGAVAAGAPVAVVVGEDHDDVGPIGGLRGQRKEQAEDESHVIWRQVRGGWRRRRPERSGYRPDPSSGTCRRGRAHAYRSAGRRSRRQARPSRP